MSQQRRKPTVQELIAASDRNGYIQGVVEMSLQDIVRMDEDKFLDTISEKLTGRETLQEVQYEVAGAKDNLTVLVRVKGSIERIVEEFRVYGN